MQSSAAAGNFYAALHTSDPGEAGKQNANEATYGSYIRAAVARSAGGWTISGNNASNAALVTFAKASSGSETLTHFSVGYESSGATKILGSAALTTSIAVVTNVTPEFAVDDLDHNED